MSKPLTPTEQYVADFLAEDPEKIAKLSITALSLQANVSTATIVRTVQKLGYEGFTDYKLSLKQTLKAPTYENLQELDFKIKEVILENEREIMKTIRQLRRHQIEDALQAIASADRVYLFARGFSEKVAEEIEVKLHLLDKQTELYTDPNIIRRICRRATRQDVALMISLNGETTELVEAARTMLQADVPILLITANSDGTLVDLATIAFIGHQSDISYFPDYEVRSRLPLQVIARILLDAYTIRLNK